MFEEGGTPVDSPPEAPDAVRPAEMSGAEDKYPRVDRGHIVPKAYLRFFAIDEQIGLRLTGDPTKRLVTSIDNAAVRRRFYRRTRPDGTPIDDIGWSMSHIETQLPQVLEGLDEHWPPTDGHRAILAEFLGLQSLRSPAFAAWQRRVAEDAIADWESQGKPFLKSGKPATPEERERVIRLFSEDTCRFKSMLSFIPKAASAFGSMHWSLVAFDDPVLAASDHPVVRWPIREGARKPAREPEGLGLMSLLEVRVELTPKRALLMTWIDDEDTSRPLIGAKHHAANLNAFVVAQAETQWFHRPGTTPRRGSGSFLRLSADLLGGYDSAAAFASQRRQRIQESLNRRIGKEFERTIEMVSVTRRSPNQRGA